MRMLSRISTPSLWISSSTPSSLLAKSWLAGLMTRASGLVVLCAALGGLQPAFAQYEDLVDLEDAPTRTEDEEGMICTIEGVQFSKREGTDKSKELSIVFLLTEKPSAYFNYYDPVKKAIVFDFYDTHIGESIMEPIIEDPITNSSVELFKLDLNKDVAGLKPDIRDVVRVSLFTKYDFEYDVQEDYGVITMSFTWGKKIAGKLARKSNAIMWQLPLGLAVLGGGGYLLYDQYLKPEPEPPTFAETMGLPPMPPQ